MKHFTVFGRPGCGFCVQAKNVLEAKKLPFNYVDIHAEKFLRPIWRKLLASPCALCPRSFMAKPTLAVIRNWIGT
ncbi:MAG: glutaredoxin domain-containing protein [Porticoccaceae bacterium]